MCSKEYRRIHLFFTSIYSTYPNLAKSSFEKCHFGYIKKLLKINKNKNHNGYWTNGLPQVTTKTKRKKIKCQTLL